MRGRGRAGAGTRHAVSPGCVTTTGSPMPTAATAAANAVGVQRLVHRVAGGGVRGAELEHPAGGQRVAGTAQPDPRLGGQPQRPRSRHWRCRPQRHRRQRHRPAQLPAVIVRPPLVPEPCVGRPFVNCPFVNCRSGDAPASIGSTRPALSAIPSPCSQRSNSGAGRSPSTCLHVQHVVERQALVAEHDVVGAGHGDDERARRRRRAASAGCPCRPGRLRRGWCSRRPRPSAGRAACRRSGPPARPGRSACRRRGTPGR